MEEPPLTEGEMCVREELPSLEAASRDLFERFAGAARAPGRMSVLKDAMGPLGPFGLVLAVAKFIAAGEKCGRPEGLVLAVGVCALTAMIIVVWDFHISAASSRAEHRKLKEQRGLLFDRILFMKYRCVSGTLQGRNLNMRVHNSMLYLRTFPKLRGQSRWGVMLAISVVSVLFIGTLCIDTMKLCVSGSLGGGGGSGGGGSGGSGDPKLQLKGMNSIAGYFTG